MNEIISLILKDPERAADRLLEDLHASPDSELWLVFGRLADAWRRSGHVSAATAALICAFKCAPECSRIRADLVYRFQRLLFDTKSFADAEELVKLRGVTAEALLDRATNAWACERFDTSIECASSALTNLAAEEIDLRRWGIQLLIHSSADSGQGIRDEWLVGWENLPPLAEDVGGPYYQYCWTEAVVCRVRGSQTQADKLYREAAQGLLSSGQLLSYALLTLELIAHKIESDPLEAKILAGDLFPVMVGAGLEAEARAALLGFCRAASVDLTARVVSSARSALRRSMARPIPVAR